MKKFIIIATLVAGLVSGLSARGANLIVNEVNLKMLKVPHVYEYNSLNPEKYWWCGHAAFSSAIKSLGVNKNLQDIHEIFIIVDYDSGTRIYSKRDNYAASMIHLQLASKEYGVKYIKTYLSKKDDFWNKIISSTKSKKPTIVLSKSYYSYENKKWYNTGHYFVVIGYYKDKNNKKFVILNCTQKSVVDKKRLF